MDISCYLITKGEFKAVVIPEELLTNLSVNLRTKGVETVHFADDKSIEVEGVYVPAKGIKNIMMVAPNIE